MPKKRDASGGFQSSGESARGGAGYARQFALRMRRRFQAASRRILDFLGVALRYPLITLLIGTAAALIGPLLWQGYAQAYGFGSGAEDARSLPFTLALSTSSLLTAVLLWLTLLKQQQHSSAESDTRFALDMMQALELSVSRIRSAHWPGAGAGALAHFVLKLESFMRKTPEATDGADLARKLGDHYETFYSGYGHDVGHYLRLTFNILEFIDTSRLDARRKQALVHVFRAQLRQDELILLFYNAFSSFAGREGKSPGDPTTFDLIRKYKLLRNLDASRLHPRAAEMPQFHELGLKPPRVKKRRLRSAASKPVLKRRPRPEPDGG